MIKNILLGLLNYQPMTGYDLKQMIDHSTSHFWHAHHSQIYTSLREMEGEGLLTSEFIKNEGQPDRRVYTISELGKKSLSEWLDQPLTELPPLKDEFIVRLFFSAHREPQKTKTELILQRELHLKHLAEYHYLTEHLLEEQEKEHPELARDVAFWQATLKMGIRYEQIYLEWINETIAMIENG